MKRGFSIQCYWNCVFYARMLVFLAFRSSYIYVYIYILSIHVCGCLPLFLLPLMLQCSTLVGNLPASILFTCPTISTFLSGFCHYTISVCWDWLLISSFLSLRSAVLSQSINVKFVGRRYTRRPGAPTVVSGKHDHKVHSWVVSECTGVSNVVEVGRKSVPGNLVLQI